MRLTPMRFKEYTWPHNPRVCTVEHRRRMAVHPVPFGRCVVQDLGGAYRVLRGQGEFVGEGAYEEFRRLEAVFRQEGPGLLVHPVWQTAEAYFVELSLSQEPRADYVRYTFTFWEAYGGHSTGTTVKDGDSTATGDTGRGDREEGRWHTVVRGDTLWGLARRYGVELTRLVGLNPQLKNPNLIYPGQKVRVA